LFSSEKENLKMLNPILKALGLSLETLPGPENELLKTILKDNFVTLRSQELMVEHFAAQAIEKMHAAEKAALIKKITPPPSQNSVRWSVGAGMKTDRPRIMAKFRAEEIWYDGQPENAVNVVFHGERPPTDILQKYAAAYDPSNAPHLDAAYWIARTAKATRPTFPVLE
jgi:hypothetical protein